MSDEIEITHGGAIAVDTEVLRDVVVRLRFVSNAVSEAADAAYLAHQCIVDAPGLSVGIDTVALWNAADRCVGLRTRIDEAASGTALMADAYELVELQAERDALAITDPDAAQALQWQIEDLAATDDRLSVMATYLMAGWEQTRHEGVDGQFDGWGALTGANLDVLTAVAMLIGGSSAFGKLAPGKRLNGTPDPTYVRPVRTSSPPSPPASLADAMGRFPDADGAQVRVEKYTFADGTSRFVAYVKGTEAAVPGGEGSPWDMKSNVELYTGRASASYEATMQALRLAGAEPGDVVDVYGHSQGAMIGSYMAMDDEFEVKVLVGAGNPTEPTLREDQLMIQLAHTDDLVSGLSGGGSAGGTGSPDSITVRREGDSKDGLWDAALVTHWMRSYAETAEMVDASDDPRVDAYREYLGELSQAVTIESTEYAATRTG